MINALTILKNTHTFKYVLNKLFFKMRYLRYVYNHVQFNQINEIMYYCKLIYIINILMFLFKLY